MSFLANYARGWAVQVTLPDGGILIPVGFVIFDDGVGWAEDAILDPLCSKFPIHHLLGKVIIANDRIVCRGHVFESMPVVPKPGLARAWDSLGPRDRIVTHAIVESDIKRDRRRFNDNKNNEISVNLSTRPNRATCRSILYEPISDIFEAAHLLLLAEWDSDLELKQVSELIRLSDMSSIGRYTDHVWGVGSFKGVEYDPSPLPGEPRMPTSAQRTAILERDGYHCRFCGIPVIDATVRKKIATKLPNVLRWGSKNRDQHTAFQCMWLQFDHLLPYSRGGRSNPDNVVIACAPCNFGRMQSTLEEAELQNPLGQPLRTTWKFSGKWRGLHNLAARLTN